MTPDQLAKRWQALGADPTFEDIAGKIELTEWGKILISPVGKSHGIAAMRIAEALRKALGGHTMAEAGVATAIGVRAPDVAWCSDSYLAAHPEEMPLSGAPELCVEIVSASNALPKLREKAMAYVNAGAVEAWIVYPHKADRDLRPRGAQAGELLRGRHDLTFRPTLRRPEVDHLDGILYSICIRDFTRFGFNDALFPDQQLPLEE